MGQHWFFSSRNLFLSNAVIHVSIDPTDRVNPLQKTSLKFVICQHGFCYRKSYYYVYHETRFSRPKSQSLL